MIKIGILLTSPKEVGGIYQYSLCVIEALQSLERKQKIKVDYYYSDKHWLKHLPKNSNKIYIYKSLFIKFLRKTVNLFLPKSYKFLILKEFLNEEVKVLNNSKCDLIVFPSQNITSYQINKKSLSTIHDLMHRYEPKFSEYTKKIIIQRDIHYQNICNYSDGILVDSFMGKNHVINSYSVNKKKIFILPFVVPNYLKKKKKLNIFKKFNIKEQYLFYPAQFWEHKNHFNLIKAFKHLIKNNKDISLVFCGAKKNYYYDVLNFVKLNNLEKKIFFLGRVNDDVMSSLYSNALATVYASLCGPTNIPPLESISLDTPLICSNAYSMKNQMGNSAIYFNPKNYKSISKKINLVLKNKKLREKLIINGRKRILEYNIKHFSKLLEHYIKKTIVINDLF